MLLTRTATEEEEEERSAMELWKTFLLSYRLAKFDKNQKEWHSFLSTRERRWNSNKEEDEESLERKFAQQWTGAGEESPINWREWIRCLPEIMSNWTCNCHSNGRHSTRRLSLLLIFWQQLGWPLLGVSLCAGWGKSSIQWVLQGVEWDTFCWLN